MNPQCLAYMHGCNTRNRDTQAVVAIALASVSRISTGQPLEPFNASHFKTGRQVATAQHLKMVRSWSQSTLEYFGK
jgi:hypothetical protein